MPWTTSPIWDKSAPSGSDGSPEYRISTLPPAHLPHQPWTALWGTWNWCWVRPCTTQDQALYSQHFHGTAAGRHWIVQMFFPDMGASTKALIIICPLHRTQGINEWCLGVTGCNVFPLILLPTVMCCSVPGKQQPMIQLCCATSLITNRYHLNKLQQCFPTPLLPQTTEDVITRVCAMRFESDQKPGASNKNDV